MELESIKKGRVRRAWWYLFFAFAIAYVILQFPPWRFSLPRAGLDPSWVDVITLGAREHWQWGRDIAFTYGPLGYLFFNSFDPDILTEAMLWNAALAIAFAVGIVAILPRTSIFVSTMLLLLIVFPAVSMGGRLAFMGFAVLSALLYFGEQTTRNQTLAVAMAIAAGAYGLVYFSAVVVSLGIFAILDLDRVLHRRWPVFVALFAVAFTFAYVGAGQHLGNLPAFLRGGFEAIAGYSTAMGTAGSRIELAVYLLLSILAFALVVRIEWRSIALSKIRRNGVFIVAVLGIYWFTMFKTGFVRHDLHSLWAWNGLAFAMAVYVAFRWRHEDGRRVRWMLFVLSLIACLASIAVRQNKVSVVGAVQFAQEIMVLRVQRSIDAAFEAATGPSDWIASWKKRRELASAEVRSSAPLPHIAATIDTIPNIQSSVIAHGLAYRPRPVFQDYAAYTPWLIEVNRRHYRSGGAAEYVFFRPDSIDARYPLLDQGAALTELLTYYDPVRFANDLLVLQRRAKPMLAKVTDPTPISILLGQWQSLPPSVDPVFLTFDVKKSSIGSIANVLLRAPALMLSVRLADGTQSTFRVVDGIARAGFLLSPVVADSLGFAALGIRANSALAGKLVLEFRLDTESETGRIFYAEPIAASTSELRLDPLEVAARGEWLRPMMRRQQAAASMTAASPQKPPFVEVRGTEVFAHAPAEVSLAVPAGSRLHANFGIKRGAFAEGGNTDGVCFRVSAETPGAARIPIFERCLEPVKRKEDQPEQTLDVASGLSVAGKLVFETTCIGNCAWDWSYWKDIDVVQ